MEARETPDTLKDLLRQAAEGDETVFEVVSKIVGEGDGAKPQTTVTIMRREVQPEPPLRRESPRRAHVFHDVAGFTVYLKRFGTPDTVVLIDAIRRKAEAVLDEKAVRGFEVVEFVPPLHPAFKPWTEVFGKPLPIRQAADFLRLQRHVILDPAPRDLLAVLGQVRLSRSVTIDATGGAQGVNAVTVETRFQGQAKQTPVELPETIGLVLPLLVDTAEKAINVDLVVDAGSNNAPVVILSSADVEQAIIDLFDGFESVIRQELSGRTVALGSVAHQDWPVIETD